MVRSFYTDTVTRRRYQMKNSPSGGSVRDLTAPYVDTPISGCRWQAVASRESGERDEFDVNLFCSPGTEVDPVRDDVVIEGETYKVYGLPLPRRGITGGVAHVHVKLRAVNRYGA